MVARIDKIVNHISVKTHVQGFDKNTLCPRLTPAHEKPVGSFDYLYLFCSCRIVEVLSSTVILYLSKPLCCKPSLATIGIGSRGLNQRSNGRGILYPPDCSDSPSSNSPLLVFQQGDQRIDSRCPDVNKCVLSSPSDIPIPVFLQYGNEGTEGTGVLGLSKCHCGINPNPR